MRKYGIWLTILLLILAWTALPGESQETNQSSGRDVTVTVTAEPHGRKSVGAVEADEVFVHQNNNRRPVVRWVPATGQNGGLDLAILIDESLNASIANHFGELKSFIRSLPSNTKVAVAYAAYGNAEMAQDFTADHERAAAAIHLPRGPYVQNSSTYMALTSLIKHWPKDSDRRAVLVLSDGLDLYWGLTEALPPDNPSLNQAIAAAQRHNVNVYTIYAESVGNMRQNSFLINVGQSCLSVLAQATGGKSYFEGLQTPVDFQTIFKNLHERLENQYLLTFQAQQGKKESYDRFHLTSERSGVKLIAPKRVFVPGTAM